MIEVICMVCGRKNFSGEEHVGKMLKCGGCDRPVLIGTYKSQQAPVKWSQQDGTATVKSAGRWSKRHSALKQWHWVAGTLGIVAVAFLYLMIRSSDATDKADVFDKAAPIHASNTAEPPPVQTSTPPVQASTSEPPQDPFFASGAAPTVEDCEAKVAESRHTTGEELGPFTHNTGRGLLSLVNGTGTDAVVLLFSSDTGTLARSVFIRKHQTARLARLSPDKYWVRVTVGDDWDDHEREFLKCVDYFEFPHEYTFAETERDDGIEYDKLTLTLNEVPDGNVRKVRISRQAFWANTARD